MRYFFTCLLVFSVLAGGLARAFVADPCESLLKQHAYEHSEHDHDKPCDPQHEKNCPVEHHHQGVCSHCMPMVTDLQKRVAAGAIDFSLSLLLGEVVIFPDEPVAELDKPPLI